jgi:hypothetical protein
MTSTTTRIFRFHKELERLKNLKEQAYTNFVESRTAKDANEMHLLSEKIHTLTEFQSMFNALFHAEIEEAKTVKAA